jgi:hypothetical protein
METIQKGSKLNKKGKVHRSFIELILVGSLTGIFAMTSRLIAVPSLELFVLN